MAYVILFTRHQLTDDQLQEIQNAYPKDVNLEYHQELASRNITSLSEAEEVAEELIALCSKAPDGYTHIYGVIPVPVRAMFHKWTNSHHSQKVDINIYEAFNRMRSVEGQKPTFEHVCWMLTEQYFL